MKRILAAALAALMLLPLASCATADDPDETSANNKQTDAVSEGESKFFPPIEKKDYDEAAFNMIGWTEAGEWYYAEDYESSEEKTAILNK